MEPVWIRFQRIYLHIFPGYIMHYIMNPAKKCVVILAAVQLDIRILLSKWDICANKDLCKAGLFVCVAAGKNDWITIQILEHITKVERSCLLYTSDAADDLLTV